MGLCLHPFPPKENPEECARSDYCNYFEKSESEDFISTTNLLQKFHLKSQFQSNKGTDGKRCQNL